MAITDEAAIGQLMSELVAAWNSGDAQAYGARYRADATFTNVNGALYAGREEFIGRHAEIFQGYLRGATLGLAVRQLSFIRPDVAAAGTAATLHGVQTVPPGARAGADGAMRTSLLMVLVKEGGRWWIAACHNVWNPAG
jgi:uncharacterized protein (TIGR02246 family)